jgi:prepilin-type N-terminal cleavage/methylation domain-containing protein
MNNMSNHMNRNSRGFTLIELLIVIAIIGILATVVLASLNAALQKARNAQRVMNMNQVAKALELYYDDHGIYPIGGHMASYAIPAWSSECATAGSLTPGNVIIGLVPTYLPVFPTDPSMDKAHSYACYMYRTDGKDYALIDFNVSYSDSGFDYTSQPSLIDPQRDGVPDCSINYTNKNQITAWKVASEGACAW